MFNRFKKPTFGLVLNGGGSRGAYQIGVLLALKKYGLYDKCKCIAGGSVGSFVALIYLLNDPLKAIEIWKEIDDNVIKSPKQGNFFSKLPIKGAGFFSREGVVNFINSNFDLEQFIRPSIPVYISCAKEDKDNSSKKRKDNITYSPVYFKLSDYNKDEVMTILLASSAIPLVYDKVEFRDDYYVDCLKADSEPYKALDNEEFDMLFVVPLTKKHNSMDYTSYKVPVIDFELPSLVNMVSTLNLDMIDFTEQKTDDYIVKGYLTAKAIFEEMKKQHLLHKPCSPRLINFLRRKRGKAKDLMNKIYSLESFNIDEESLHFERWTLDRVIEDFKKGKKEK